MLGGLEVLALSTVIGGISGYFFKNKEQSALGSITLGLFGGLITTYLLATFLLTSDIAMPFYGILGSWLSNYIARKIKKKN